ncbi:MAG: START domain-containing protein [Gammaproteobacteria bacterium]|nr:START domain-containing protein [Gammaproteobacteria bacterium]
MLLLLWSCGDALADWQLIHDEEAIQVFTRPVLGSPIRELRGTTTVHSSLSALVALLQDADANAEWVYHSGGVKVLQRISERESMVYAITEAPWPIADRDAIIRFSLTQNPQTLAVTIAMTAVPDYLPPQPSYVRMPVFQGFWLLQPRPHGDVDVVCQLHAEPGGVLPTWLANPAAERAAFRTLANLRAIITQPKYQEQRLAFITEPK